MSKYAYPTKYAILGFDTYEDFDQGRGYSAEYGEDTLAEAKKRAKHMLTDEWMRSGERSTPLLYVQVVRQSDDECVWDLNATPVGASGNVRAALLDAQGALDMA